MKLLALGILSLCVIFPARADEEPLNYYYHGRPKALALDATQVAVRIRSTSSLAKDGGASLPSGLSTRGFRPTDVVGEEIAGWTILDAATAKQNIAASGRNMSGSNSAPVQSESQTTHALIKSLIDSNDPAIEFVSPVFRDAQGGLVLISSRVLIGFANNCGAPQRAALRSLIPEGATQEQLEFAQPNNESWQINSRDGFVVLGRANDLAQQSGVTYAEPDMLITGHTDLVPNDPSFSNSWGLANTGQSGGQIGFDMEASAAWDITLGSASVIVLILDCGVQQNHPDINQIGGKDLTSDAPGTNGGPVSANDNHGTWVAGCVSGRINNSIGSAGLAPAVQVASARCHKITSSGGSFNVNFSWVINALNWGQSIGARVSNNSNTYNLESSALESVYSSTRANGMVHFAAAGNSGESYVSYPASIPSVNSVGAVNRFGQRASFSQYGDGLKFMAPGDQIFTTDRTGSSGGASGDYATVNGTSFASPYAGAVAALIISQWPTLTAAQVEARLQAACIDMGPVGYDTGYGYGLVDAFRAVSGINLPNLTPFQPSGWSDKIVVSSTAGSHTDTIPPISNDTLYLNFAVNNNGSSSADAQFFVQLFVDEQLRQVFSSTPPLPPNVDWEIQDYSLGVLPAGTHTIRIKVDSTDAVLEKDENDNEYVKTIGVTDPPPPTPTPPPVSATNISTRGNVGTGDNVLIGGVIIAGNESKKVLVRAIGPTLANYNVSGAMSDPMLELHDGTTALIAHNDDWGTSEIDGVITQDQVAEIQATLPPGDNRESAIIATLTPGNYTAILHGKNDTGGIALVEVYDLDPNGAARLSEISTRGNVQAGDNVMIGGIILSGAGTTDVLLRAIGPELSQYGVSNALQDPELELHNSNGTVLATNGDWRSDQEQEIINTGRAPGDDRESAILTTLNAGNYTAILYGKNGTDGIALVEAYILSGP